MSNLFLEGAAIGGMRIMEILEVEKEGGKRFNRENCEKEKYHF